jgi:molybdopterin synthase sulfur carrier subunit
MTFSTTVIKYFASLREKVGRAEDVLDMSEPATVAELWQRLHDDALLPDTLRVAINHEFAMPDDMVQPGDEIAFFPPVTGG